MALIVKISTLDELFTKIFKYIPSFYIKIMDFKDKFERFFEMEKETECENCGLHVYYTFKIKDVKSDKLLTVCKMCAMDIRNKNLKWEGKAKEAGIQEEIEKLKGVEERRSIREEAEKRFYGKINENKRAAISEKDKEVIFSKFNNECTICNRKEGLHIHHKDHNPSNNRMDNLIVLCGVCHKKIHMKVR